MGARRKSDMLGLLPVFEEVKKASAPESPIPAEEAKKKTARKYPGVYKVEGKKGTSIGIDYIHPQTGARIQKILKGVFTEAEAAEVRAIEIADAARGAIQRAYGIKARPQTISFAAAVDLYTQWAKENKKSGRTDEYRSRALKIFFKGKLMGDINPLMIERYKTVRAKLVTRKSVNKEICLGSQVFVKASEWKKFEGENPFRTVARYEVKKGKKPGAFTVDQVVRIRAEIGHEVKRDMVDFNFYTGWRIGEIRKLKWEDVDLASGKAWILDPKNGETVEIELSAKAQEVIRRQKKRGLFVFCKLNGKPFTTNLHTAIRNAAARAGVKLPPRKAWHILRRTWASLMLQNGCDVETLRVLGNWKDYQMPLWYSEAAGAERRKAVLDQLPDLDKNRVREN